MTLADQPSPPIVRTRVHDRRGGSGRNTSDGVLQDQVGRCERPALEETYRLYGAAAYSVAVMITRSSEQAQHAVVSAFAGLPADARRDPTRSLRLKVLDATRRQAGQLASGSPDPAEPHAQGRPGEVFLALAPDERDVVALAVSARCCSADIADVLGIDRATVHRRLRSGLRNATAFLGGTGEVRP